MILSTSLQKNTVKIDINSRSKSHDVLMCLSFRRMMMTSPNGRIVINKLNNQ